ncbi:UDP-N-acetylmuramoyl-L-alanine--D-glutamate ligase [Buchananella felis]|uniref:UDP-N-acetylmuramoyl-L-alanine--D-glutamate ligase n=1 Tax=Buchananella felis TaxID=3231492 RepID=UPI0035297A1E
MSELAEYVSSLSRPLVLGLGTTGVAVLEVLSTLGAHPIGLDTSEEAVERARAAAPRAQVQLASDAADLAARAIAAAPRLVITSPGIAPHTPVRLALAEAGVPVISEIELARRLQEAGSRPDTPWLAITGTNGKTTTVRLTAALLESAGLRTVAVGNVGTPLIRVAAELGSATGAQALALELSSFQLQDTGRLGALGSVCLNLAPDHLDWHGSLEHYRAAKARVYEGTRAAAIYTPDPATRAMVEEADVAEGARAIGVTLGVPGPSELGVVEDILVDRAFLDARHREARQLATFADLSGLSGGEVPAGHLVVDVLAATALALSAGLDPQSVAPVLRSFQLDSHRGQVVEVSGGVTYVDNSKATNPHAARAALAGVAPGTAVWIVGGDTKGTDLTPLVAEVAGRLRGAVVIGKETTALVGALERNGVDCQAVPHGSPEAVSREAAARAARMAQPGDTVLLAPAAASWDQFSSYGQRGDLFAAAVHEMGETR